MSKEIYQVKNALVNYYLVVMFTLFPFFYTEQYSNIRHDKLYLFLTISIVLVFVETIIFLYDIYANKNCEVKWYRVFSVTDYAFFAFILSCVISTALSSYPMDSVSGTQGRNNGLILYLLYFFVYVIISRFFVIKKYILPTFAIGCLVVYVLCILNFFYIDPLGIFENYSEKVALDFTSTIGNKNYMASFCCLSLPVFLMLYINIKDASRYIYLIVSAIGFSALICSNSECGFLGFIPTLAIIFIYCSKSYDRIFKFFVGLSALLMCGKMLRLFFLLFPKNKNLGAMQKFFVDSFGIYLVIFLSVILSVLIYLFKKDKNPSKLIFILSVILFSLGLVSVLALFIYFTFVDRKTQLGPVTSYFRFSEKWGTHRGYMWIKSAEIFNNASVKDKFFGTGMDTFFTAFSPYFTELNSKYGNSSTNSAHNEFINYLITIGIAGVVSYITLLAAVIVRVFKNAKDNIISVAFVFGIVCYVFQSAVNIAQPITTPYLFIFIGICEAFSRKNTNAEDKQFKFNKKS